MLKNMFVWHCRPRSSAGGSVDFFFTKGKQKFPLQIHSKCKFCKQKSPREDSDQSRTNGPINAHLTKSTTKLFVNAINMYVTFNLLILEKQTYF